MDGRDWERVIARIAPRDLEGHQGRRWRTHCVIHQDSTPSMDLYADGRYKCHGCGDHGSYIDLLVLASYGKKLSPREHSHDSGMRQAYAKAFAEAAEFAWDTGSYGLSRQDRPRRDFTEIEQRFIAACHEQVFRPALLGDSDMKAYLRGRGVYELHPAFGACRPEHWPEISAIAYEQFNDRTLIDSVGFESRKRPGSLMIGHMVLVFHFQQGKITYYQGRRTRFADKWRYYNPSDIKKIPIILEPQNPRRTSLVIGSEGFFKTAWLSQYGWTTLSFMDANPEQWSNNQISQLRDGLYAEDNDDNGQGSQAGNVIRRRSWSEGLNIDVMSMPKPYKDLDTWALSRPLKQAEAHLRAVYLWR